MKQLEGHALVPEGGRLESSGSFTLDPVRAREQLARYQVQEPALFFLHFVQAASLAGCPIEISLNEPSLIKLIGYDLTIPLEQLSKNLIAALEPGEPSSLRCLLTGINGLLGQPSVQLSVVFGPQEIDLASGKVRPAAEPLDGVALRLQLPRALRLHGRHLLAERCGLCPVSVLVDGTEVGGLASQRRLFGEDHANLLDAVLTCEPTSHREVAVPAFLGSLRQTAERDAWIVLWTGANAKTVVRMTRAGVIVEIRTVDIGIPGVVATVAVDELRTDLSGFQTVEADFDSLLPWLRQQSTALGRSFLQNGDKPVPRSGGLPPAAITTLVSFVLMFVGFAVAPELGFVIMLCFFLSFVWLGVVASRRSRLPEARARNARKEVLKRLSTCPALQESPVSANSLSP